MTKTTSVLRTIPTSVVLQSIVDSVNQLESVGWHWDSGRCGEHYLFDSLELLEKNCSFTVLWKKQISQDTTTYEFLDAFGECHGVLCELLTLNEVDIWLLELNNKLKTQRIA